MTTEERWKPCFGGYYSVSDLGRVRRERRGRGTWIGRILRTPVSSTGYPMVDLYDGVSHRLVAVHQLVAEVFIGPAEGRQVNHIDGVKTNSALCNLEYVSCSDNHLHAFRTGLRSNIHKAKLTADAVREIRHRLCAGETQTSLAAEYGVRQATISAAWLRETWRHVP